MFVGIVYVAGSLTKWSGRVNEQDIIAHVRSPWRWHVRLMTRNAFSGLDRSKCGYAILKDGVVIEHIEAETQEPGRSGSNPPPNLSKPAHPRNPPALH